jgi:hypothetical protein
MTVQLWIATWRTGLDHHRVPADSTHTACGRAVSHGQIVSAADVARLKSKACQRCWPTPEVSNEPAR